MRIALDPYMLRTVPLAKLPGLVDVLVAQVPDQGRQLGQGDGPQHVGVEGDLHGCGF